MAEKYEVSREFMDTLNELADSEGLKANEADSGSYVDGSDILEMDEILTSWWCEVTNAKERNNRLIAIIKWLNGEDMFEVEKEKWVVSSKWENIFGSYGYLRIDGSFAYPVPDYDVHILEKATIFESKEEAEKWVIPAFEAVKI